LIGVDSPGVKSFSKSSEAMRTSFPEGSRDGPGLPNRRSSAGDARNRRNTTAGTITKTGRRITPVERRYQKPVS